MAFRRADVLAPYPPEPQGLCPALTGILRRSHLPVTLILDASNGVPCRLHGTVPLKAAEGPRDLAPPSGYAGSTLSGVPRVALPAIPVQCAPQADHGRPRATVVPCHRATLLMQPAQPLRDLDPAVGCPRGASKSVQGRSFPPDTLFPGAFKSVQGRSFPADTLFPFASKSVQRRSFPPDTVFFGTA